MTKHGKTQTATQKNTNGCSSSGAEWRCEHLSHLSVAQLHFFLELGDLVLKAIQLEGQGHMKVKRTRAIKIKASSLD